MPKVLHDVEQALHVHERSGSRMKRRSGAGDQLHVGGPTD